MASGWPDFWNDIRASVRQVKEQPASGMYLVIFVALIGGGGVWLAFFQSLKTGVENWGTYTIAIAASAAVDGMLGRPAARRSVTVFIWTLAIFAVLLALAGYHESAHDYALFLEIVASFIAWFLWIVANGRDPRFVDDPTAAIGSKPTDDLPGSLAGLKTD